MDHIRAVIHHTKEHAVFPLVCADHCAWLRKKEFSDVAHDPEQLADAFEYGLNIYASDGVMLFVDAYVEAQAMGCPVRYAPYPQLEGPRSGEHGDRTGVVIDAAILLQQRISVPLFVSIKGPFSLASFLSGVENFLKMILTNEKAARRLIEEALDHQISYVKRLLDTGAHIFIGDPVASSSVISPNAFSDFAMEPLKTMTRQIKHGDRIAGIHICGDTKPIMSMLDDIDADILSVEDITPRTRTVKMGGVSTRALIRNDREQVRKEVKTALEMHPLILSTSCDVPAQTDPDILKTMISAYHEHKML